MQYTFGGYTLDTQRYDLCQADTPLQLHPKVFDLLVYLLQHRDRVVTRQELFDTLWPAQFVSDDALEWVIAAARRAVEDSGRTQRVIKTIRTRGYRWVAPVAVYPPPLPHDELLPDSTRDLDITDSAAVPPPVAGERKQVTVLACALSSLVTQAAGLEAETLYTIRQRVFAVAQQAVQGYDGTIQHFVDNTCLAIFGAPVAQEDHARRAVLAALRIQDSLRHLGTVLAPEVGLEGAVCLGVHTGEVIVGPIGNDPRQIALAVGDTTQMADQLLRLAEPGAILLSAATERLLPGLLRLARVAPAPVPGIPTPPAVYQALGLAPHTTVGWHGRRVVRQFVGRAYEMATLQALLAQVEAGHGQVVGIAGEPGMGKSRLLYEFRQWVQQTSCTLLMGRCVSYGQATPYLPLLDLVRQACGLTEPDTPEAMTARVGQYLQSIGMDAEAETPYILRLLNLPDRTEPVPPLSPQTLRARIFAALLQMQLHASSQRPLVLAVEDMHWIDPTSEEWLLQLVDRLFRAPILLLMSYRSGYQPDWLSKSYATQLALPPLTADESQWLVRAVLPPQAVAGDLVPAIVAKGEGNPFFLEELAQAVGEHGGLHPTLALPETVQAVLATRLDHLPPAAKALAQVAAVIGAEVPGSLLQAIMALADMALRQCLAPLQEAELLYETRSGPEPVYAFQHALTHEVAYQSLLRSARQHYHHQIAAVLVTRYVDTVETRPEVVAHHYTEAGRFEQALPYWQWAGERAAGRSAHREAIVHCTRGLGVLAMLSETRERVAHELRLQVALGFAHMGAAGPAAQSTAHAFERALELCARVDDTPHTLMALRGLSTVSLFQGYLQPAQALAEQLLCLSQRVGDRVHGHKAHLQLGRIAFYQGELQTARTHEEQALTLAPPPHNGRNGDMGTDMGVDVRAYLAQCLWLLGYPDQARSCVRASLVLTDTHPHPMSRVQALAQAAHIHACCGVWPAVQAYADALVTLASDHGFAWNRLYAVYYRGLALVAQSHTAIGMAEMQQGMAVIQGHGAPLQLSFLAGLAEAYGWSGQVEEGLALLAEALALLQASGCHIAASRLYRIQGKLLLARSPDQPAEAEHCFYHALAVARQQQARGLELQAALCLSRLWQRQGKRQEAHKFLAPVYGWFTEGFDTADLQEAQTLLRQLSVAP